VRRLAYADPPYPGTAARYSPGVEVDHAELVERLGEYDGWALSTSAAALRDVWNLAPHARCAAWLKTFAGNGWSRVRWCWEPVLFVTDRRGLRPGESSTVWDGLVCAPDLGPGHWQEIAGKGGGAKPGPFVEWVLELLDVGPGDELDDLYPGSGAVRRHAGYRQSELLLSRREDRLSQIVWTELDHVRALLARRRLDLATDDELGELGRWEEEHEELLDELDRSRHRRSPHPAAGELRHIGRLGDERPPGPFG
jgi:hypothetical protein